MMTCRHLVRTIFAEVILFSVRLTMSQSFRAYLFWRAHLILQKSDFRFFLPDFVNFICYKEIDKIGHRSNQSKLKLMSIIAPCTPNATDNGSKVVISLKIMIKKVRQICNLSQVLRHNFISLILCVHQAFLLPAIVMLYDVKWLHPYFLFSLFLWERR